MICVECQLACCVDELTVTAWVVSDSRSFVEGQTAILACQSDSHGDIQLTWMKDGEPLALDDDETGDGSTLTLSDLTTVDSGEYVCVGTREHESVTSTPLSISVTGQCLLMLPASYKKSDKSKVFWIV